MAVYRFTTQWPVDTGLPEDIFTCTIHMNHTAVGGAVSPGDLTTICTDLATIWDNFFGGTAHGETKVTAYGTGDAAGNYPLATARLRSGNIWTCAWPREICVCLSFAGDIHKPAERGRIYVPIVLDTVTPGGNRVATATMNKVLGLFSTANASFPDLGGVDWQFGVYSPTHDSFAQAHIAWVDNAWDTQRRRGLKPSAKNTSVREG